MTASKRSGFCRRPARLAGAVRPVACSSACMASKSFSGAAWPRAASTLRGNLKGDAVESTTMGTPARFCWPATWNATAVWVSQR